jgi:hypothetical protein
LLLLLIRDDSAFPTIPRQHLALAQEIAERVSPLSKQLPIIETTRRMKAPRCPTDMVFIDGDYCPKVRHHCLEWLEDPKLPYARCGRYAPRAECLAAKEHLTFCIDREEFTKAGETVPENFLSFNQAARLCAATGKRLCQEREWNFACEGEQLQPYPYGWSREPKCNQDRNDLFKMLNYVQNHQHKRKQVLRDLRGRSHDFPQCISPFGVLNMVGNLDEPVVREGTSFAPMQMALKGGWWMPGRNRCRPATTAHDNDYRDVQVGARCCANLADER